MQREQAIQQIKQNLPCTNYLEKSKGVLYCCPSCGSGKGKNRTGAVKYYPDTNKIYCNVCKWSADVLDLIQEIYHTDFNGALAIAAKDYGITVENEAIQADLTNENKANDKYINDSKKIAENDGREPIKANYSAYYNECRARLSDTAAVSYLKARGISIETAAAHRIGYDPEADPVAAPGAVSGSGTPKQHPAPRLIFPINGSCYSNRSIDKNTPKEYKSMNLKGVSPQIWNAGAIYNAETVFVCEGIFTALSVIEMGASAIALNGKGNGSNLLAALDKQPSNAAFIVCFDNDPNPQTHESTLNAAKELNKGLQARGYNSTVLDITDYCEPGETDLNDILQRDKSIVAEIIKAGKGKLPDYLTDFLNNIQGRTFEPYTTGLKFFDDLLGGGVIRETLLTLMAAPGTGKTTLCQQIAEEMAAHQKPVLYLNFEMSRAQMLAKTISSRLTKKGKDCDTMQVLQGYNWTPEQKNDIEKEIALYRESNYKYLKYSGPEDIGGSSDLDKLLLYLNGIGAKAIATGNDAPAVIVDYLHLISSTKGLDNQELIKQTITGLKDYAVKYHTFVIAIAAVNRTTMDKGQLSMNSGRDSSNIEYTGDYILTLNYWEVDQKRVDPQDAEKYGELQNEEWRQMVLRLVKSRYTQPGNKAQLYYNAAGNYFRGKDGYIPETAKAFAGPSDTTTTRKRK